MKEIIRRQGELGRCDIKRPHFRIVDASHTLLHHNRAYICALEQCNLSGQSHNIACEQNGPGRRENEAKELGRRLSSGM